MYFHVGLHICVTLYIVYVSCVEEEEEDEEEEEEEEEEEYNRNRRRREIKEEGF